MYEYLHYRTDCIIQIFGVSESDFNISVKRRSFLIMKLVIVSVVEPSPFGSAPATVL